MTLVMAGLVPAIHAMPLRDAFRNGAVGSAWMPGTIPGLDLGTGMTVEN